MTLTKQQRALAIVLGLGALAVGIDRFVLDSGVTAPSGASAAAPVAAAPPTPTVTPVKATQSSGVSVADRLVKHEASMDLVAAVPDAFATSGNTKAANTSTPSRPADLPQLTITSVLSGKAAVINGVLVSVGQGRQVPLPGGTKVAVKVVEIAPGENSTNLVKVEVTGRVATLVFDPAGTQPR
ncbi:MAG: hypothetical protein AB7Q00_03725 [Phycisphaerales bacterium]|nr:MAG: hypothetical protein IPK69_08345 [Phycisphaerales bacterium]